MQSLVPVLALTILLVVIGRALFNVTRDRRRNQELFDLAFRYGLMFETGDRNALLNCNVPLFTAGDDRAIQNTLWGEWQGVPISVADYWYRTGRAEEDRSGSRLHRFTVAVIDVPAYLPALTIEPETLVSLLAEHVGFPDIDFESGDFNQRFRVQSADRKFAFQFIDPRMMRWLLSIDRRFSIQMRGTKVVLYARRLPTRDLVTLMGTARELFDRIPNLIWGEYGIDGAGKMGAGS